MARRRSNTNELQKRATDLAALEYGPQLSGIMQAIAELRGQRDSRIRQARSAGKYIPQAEAAGQQRIGAAFDAVGGAAQQGFGYADKLSAPVPGSPASALMGAVANARAAVPQNVASAKAHAITDSENRAGRARAGALYAEEAARVNFGGDAEKLRGQFAETQGRAGLRANTTYQQLLDKDSRDQRAQDAADRAAARDAAQRSNGTGPYSKPGGKGKPLPRGQQNAFRQNVSKAAGLISTLKSAGLSGKEIRELLSGGGRMPDQLLPDPNDAAKKKRIRGDKVSAFGGDIAQLALELYFNSPNPGEIPGTLTKKGRRILKTYGVKAPKQWTTPAAYELPPPFGTAN